VIKINKKFNIKLPQPIFNGLVSSIDYLRKTVNVFFYIWVTYVVVQCVGNLFFWNKPDLAAWQFIALLWVVNAKLGDKIIDNKEKDILVQKHMIDHLINVLKRVATNEITVSMEEIKKERTIN
jgi:hypothetical protein